MPISSGTSRGRLLLLLWALVWAAAGCGSSGPLEPPTGEGLTFSDPSLEAAIRSAIQKPKGAIVPSDVAGLVWLSADGWDVRGLSGIEKLTALTSLVLSNNQIADVGPVSSLTGLELLYLDRNQIADLSPLSRLRSLATLDLSSNRVEDLTALRSLTSLTALFLNGNRIHDTSPLGDLRKLEVLRLGSNRIADISPVSGLTNLYTFSAPGNLIVEITALGALRKLNLVGLSDNRIRDLTPLVNNPGINDFDTVELSGNVLSETALRVQIPALEARRVSVVLVPVGG